MNFVFVTADGCSFFAPGYSRNDAQAELCRRGMNLAYKVVSRGDADVFLVQYWTQAKKAPLFANGGKGDKVTFADDADFVKFAQKGIAIRRKAIGNRQLTVFGQIPGFDSALSPLDCIARPLQIRDCSTSSLASPKLAEVVDMNRTLAAANTGPELVDPFHFLCTGGNCRNLSDAGEPALFGQQSPVHLGVYLFRRSVVCRFEQGGECRRPVGLRCEAVILAVKKYDDHKMVTFGR